MSNQLWPICNYKFCNFGSIAINKTISSLFLIILLSSCKNNDQNAWSKMKKMPEKKVIFKYKQRWVLLWQLLIPLQRLALEWVALIFWLNYYKPKTIGAFQQNQQRPFLKKWHWMIIYLISNKPQIKSRFRLWLQKCACWIYIFIWTTFQIKGGAYDFRNQ
jgi:hypothetical protein